MMRLAWLFALLPSIAGAQAQLKPDAVPAQGVDPTQFGAKCDGATDDAAAIIAAIASAKASRQAVLLPRPRAPTARC